jgi:5S rRNA maturation endonuclease (ribonuclease M5)
LLTDFPNYEPGKLSVLCQFHDDSSPSMHVDTYGYHCWVCGASGQLVDLVIHLAFMRDALVIDDWQAILLIAHIRKLPHPVMEATETIDKKWTEEEQLLFSRIFFDSLGKPVLSHLQNNHFLQRGYTIETLCHFGLRMNTQSLYPYVLPIYQGDEFKGFVSRRECEKTTPKYVYNTGFKAAQTVGGKIVRDDVIVVEGYSDLMMTHQHGWKNVVCLFGSHCSKQQAAYLRANAKGIIIASDSDRAGEKLSLEIQSLLSDRRLYRFPFPDGIKDIAQLKRDDFDRSLQNIRRLL